MRDKMTTIESGKLESSKQMRESLKLNSYKGKLKTNLTCMAPAWQVLETGITVNLEVGVRVELKAE